MRQSDSAPPHGHFAMRVARRWHFISGGLHIFWVRLSWARRVFRSTRLEFLVRVSARCAYDQLNFHECITCLGTFSMSRSRLEVPYNVGQHIRVHRWEFRCVSTSSTSLSARLSSRLSRCPRGKSARTFPLHCTISHIASDHTFGEVCNMVACGRYGRH